MKDVCSPPGEQSPLPSCRQPSSHPTLAPNATISYVTVLPEQFFLVSPCSDKGEMALMQAVLEDALNCFAQQFVKNGIHVCSLAQEAERWFFSDNEHWPFSFINICLALSLDPGCVRVRLRQLRQCPPIQRTRKKQHVVSRTRALRATV